MSEINIPEHWVGVKCEMIFSIIKGKNPELFKVKENGMLAYLSVKYLRGESAAEFARVEDRKSVYINERDIILIFDGSKSGECFSGFEGVLSSTMAKLEFSNELLPGFVNFFMSKNFKLFNGAKSGAAIPHFDKNTFNKLIFPLPPVLEQKRIVQKIESCFKKINETEKVLDELEILLKKYRESFLSKAFKGEIIPQNPKDEPASKLLEKIRAERAKNSIGKKVQDFALISDEEKSFDLPEGWEWVRLGELKIYSIYGPRFSSDDYTNKGVPVLRTTDIDEHGRVNVLTAPKLSLKKEEIEKYKLEPYDILITRTGSIGTLSIFEDTIDAIPGAYLIQYRVAHAGFLAKWILKVLESPYGQKKLIEGSRGAGITNINVPTLDNILIPLPPLKLISQLISKMEYSKEQNKNLVEVVRRKKTALQKLKESILLEAFEGRLTTRDKNEETGHELLEKILKSKSLLAIEPTRKFPERKSTRRANK